MILNSYGPREVVRVVGREPAMGILWLKGPTVPFSKPLWFVRPRKPSAGETECNIYVSWYRSFLVSGWNQAVLGLTLPIPCPQWTKVSETACRNTFTITIR